MTVGRPGRPSKLTPERQKIIVDAIAEGNYFETACRLAGVDYTTFRKWMQDGEAGKDARYSNFFDAVTRAEAAAEASAVALIRRSIPEDWRAGAHLLERRHPERWGRREHIEHSTPDGKPLEVKHDLGKYAPAIEKVVDDLLAGAARPDGAEEPLDPGGADS